MSYLHFQKRDLQGFVAVRRGSVCGNGQGRGGRARCGHTGEPLYMGSMRPCLRTINTSVPTVPSFVLSPSFFTVAPLPLFNIVTLFRTSNLTSNLTLRSIVVKLSFGSIRDVLAGSQDFRRAGGSDDPTMHASHAAQDTTVRNSAASLRTTRS
jgi:hypothetical protein